MVNCRALLGRDFFHPCKHHYFSDGDPDFESEQDATKMESQIGETFTTVETFQSTDI